MKRIFMMALIAAISACATSADDQATTTDEVTVASSKPDVSPTALTDGLEAMPQTSCNNCFVRCSNAPPTQCKWTHAMNIDQRSNCEHAGDTHCAHLGYAHATTGCTKNGTENPACACDPDGLCSPK